ncbi:MAG: MraY family glycosyltransferase [Chloroflexota bacterium]
MGGVAVYSAFALTSLVFLPLSPPVRGVLLGGLCAVVVGIVDELLTLPPLLHLIGQIGAAIVAMATGLGVLSTISNPFGGLTQPGFTLPLALGLLVTIFWLVAMMNTVNLLDGLDGLASGVAAITALLLVAWALERNHFSVPDMAHHEDLILPIILAGALFGFLPYNFYRASIFLGDSGSMFLGLALAALTIVGPAKLGTALLVLSIPVLDVAWAIVRRQLQGRSFAGGDKQHVYHRMLELGMSHLATVLVLYAFVLALAVLDLALHKTEKFVAFVLFTGVAGVALVVLELRSTRAGRQSEPIADQPSSRLASPRHCQTPHGPPDHEGVDISR